MAAKSYQGRIFWGLLLIVLGVLFLLDQLGEFDFGYMVSRWWPAIFILVGVSILIGNNFRDAGAGLFFIAFGAFFLLMRLRILDRSLWHYFWPVLIIAVGLWILLKPALAGSKKKTAELLTDELRVSTVFAGTSRRIASAEFKGGSVDVVLGGADIDLRGSGLAGGSAQLALSAVLGGIDVRVPETWDVVVHGSPVLGGIDDKTRHPQESERTGTLHVKASAVLGGIDLKN